MISLTTVLCVIVILNSSQYDTKTIQKDSDKATNITMTNTNTTNPSLVNRFFDFDGIMHNFFPNLNNGGGNHPDNFPNYPSNGNQVSNPQENIWNNGNWDDGSINYLDSPQNYPGQNVQENNPQLPGHDFNKVNGGYPVNPYTPQVNNPQYPGSNFNNFDEDNYPVNPNTPQDNNNFQYPGNHFNNLNGGNNLVNPNIPQENYAQYPGAGSNLDNSNKWNNNKYPGNYDNDPSYPDEQGQYPGSDSSWNTNNGLQNNQNLNVIVFPEDQVKGVSQPQTPGLYQGLPRDPPGILQNPGLQNGGSFYPQDSNGLNYLPNGNLQKPLLQYPQITRPVIPTTEKVAILGLPVSVPHETTQKPFVTTSTSSAMKQCVQDCPSTSEYNPVCGSNNVTYFNEGKMECARFCGIDVTAKMNGACASGPRSGIFG